MVEVLPKKSKEDKAKQGYDAAMRVGLLTLALGKEARFGELNQALGAAVEASDRVKELGVPKEEILRIESQAENDFRVFMEAARRYKEEEKG